MTSTIVNAYDEQPTDVSEKKRRERGEFPVVMLASPTRIRL